MSWFIIKKAKLIVYLSDVEYNKYVNAYAEKKHWTAADKMGLYIAGSKQNKEKKHIIDLVVDSLTREWECDKSIFLEKYSFTYERSDVIKNMYEIIWSFCDINPRFHMMVNYGETAIKPRFVDINLQVTFGTDFYIGENHGSTIDGEFKSLYRIKTDLITKVFGNLMDFRIVFRNGFQYRFKTIFDGRKTCGAISTDILLK